MGVNGNHWRPANNGSGRHRWFLIWSDESVPVQDRYHFSKAGDLIRYASFESAQRAAGRLNGDKAAKCRTCGTTWTGLRDAECNPLCYTCGLRPDLVTVDDGTDEVVQVTVQEAAAGLVRYARSLGAGSPACAVWERRALELLRS